MDWSVEVLSEKINRERRKPDIPADLEEWTQDRLRTVLADLEQIQQERGQEHFILQFVKSQVEAYKSDDDDAHERIQEKGVCECSNSECHLKQGRLPWAIRESDDITEGIIEFQQEHSNPVVLNLALDEWRNKRASVKNTLSEVLVALQRETIPEESEPADQKEESAERMIH